MAVKRRFPYRSAAVACNGGCRAEGKDLQCEYGCIGCGACEAACRFDAIHVGADGVAEVDTEKCIGCGACTHACPQQIIRVHETANYIFVRCSNEDKGADARKMCDVSCIGCGICERTCTANAIRVINHCAVIEDAYCLSCGMCAVNCPRHAIHDLAGVLTKKP